MRIFVFCALGILVGMLLFIWLVSRVRYRIGSRHVKVILFGLVVRRVALANIESVSKRRGEGWAEHWWSTLHPKHRLLVLRRRRGLCRNFIITPNNRYVFRTDLERAMRRVGAPLRSSRVETETEEELGAPPDSPPLAVESEAPSKADPTT